jgi:S1-C subfamily serine protease
MKLRLPLHLYSLLERFREGKYVEQAGVYTLLLNVFLACLLFIVFTSQQVLAQNEVTGEKGKHSGLVFYQDSVLAGKQVQYSLYVDQIIPNSPASKTALKRHDKLINLNGLNTGTLKQDVIKMNAMMASITASSVYVEIDRTDETKKTKRIGYVIELPDEETKVKSRVFGIGVTLSLDSMLLVDQIIYTAQVLGVYPNSPAEKAGVNPGDFIYMVDGVRIEGKSFEIINKVMPYHMKRIDISYYLKNQILPVRTLSQANTGPKISSPKQAAEDALQPQHDKDRDGITDDKDACPDQPGAYSQNPYENGCPE